MRPHGRPDRIDIDASQTNQEAIVSCDTQVACGIHMMLKLWARYAFSPNPSLAEQFEILAA
ncbi:hypothetical protein M2281_002814 [Mesorhizobium soli]|nr:hypothetical protein [Mesorhizobium soli]